MDGWCFLGCKKFLKFRKWMFFFFWKIFKSVLLLGSSGLLESVIYLLKEGKMYFCFFFRDCFIKVDMLMLICLLICMLLLWLWIIYLFFKVVKIFNILFNEEGVGKLVILVIVDVILMYLLILGVLFICSWLMKKGIRFGCWFFGIL